MRARAGQASVAGPGGVGSPEYGEESQVPELGEEANPSSRPEAAVAATAASAGRLSRHRRVSPDRGDGCRGVSDV